MIQFNLNIGGIMGALIAAAIMCDILLFENIPLLSINITQHMLSHWFLHWHIVVIALFPIYVAAIFFGVSMLGLILGSVMQQWFMSLREKKHKISSVKSYLG